MTEASGSDGAAWTLDVADGLLLLRCSALDGAAGTAHAFSTRRDGERADFDLGTADDGSDEMRRRRARFLTAAGIDGEAAVLRQVHGARLIEADSMLDGPPEADGAVWSGGRAAPSVRTADCVPILIVDREGRAAAAVHAGWRGCAAGIARRAVAALVRHGIAPDALVAALGPAIGPCCFEVGPEVVEALGEDLRAGREGAVEAIGGTGRFLLDLREVNRRQLAGAGLPAASIHAAPFCTRCRADLFFSHRRERGAAGRMMAAVGRRRRP